MTIQRLRFALAILVLSVAGAVLSFAASSYKVSLPSDVSIGDTKLKSGEYIVSLSGKQAVFKKGNLSVSVPVDVEKSPKKFSETTLEMSGTDLRVINLGGTDSMLVFQTAH
jgi:hypothetical protein